MQKWKILLIHGNSFFEQKNWLEAESYYEKAEQLLDKAWQSDTSDMNVLMAWICATHNLAEVNEIKGQHIVSLQYLIRSHKRALKLAKAEYLTSKLKNLALKALKITLDPILSFRKKHPICPTCINTMMGEPSVSQQHMH